MNKELEVASHDMIIAMDELLKVSSPRNEATRLVEMKILEAKLEFLDFWTSFAKVQF